MSTKARSESPRVWVPSTGRLALGLSLADDEDPPRETWELQSKLNEKIQFAIHRAGGLEAARELSDHPAFQETSVSRAAGELVDTPEVQEALWEMDWASESMEVREGPHEEEVTASVVLPELTDLLEELGL